MEKFNPVKFTDLDLIENGEKIIPLVSIYLNFHNTEIAQ